MEPPRDIAAYPPQEVVRGKACPGCRVEVFGDSGNEAAQFLGAVDVPLAGDWQLSDVDLAGVANVTASATTIDGTTSRLSEAVSAGPSWRIVDQAPPLPRLVRPDLTFARRYRILDDGGRPDPGGDTELAPTGEHAVADGDGVFEIVFPLLERLRSRERFALSIAGLRSQATQRPLGWSPALAVARSRPGSAPGEHDLDLAEFGPRGIGMTFHARLGSAAAAASRADGSLLGRLVSRLRPRLGPESAGDGLARAASRPLQTAFVFGAGLSTAPVTQREGPHAWQENIAHGGAIYQLSAGPTGGTGELHITAPVEAWRASGPSSACPGAATGAAIAGWVKDSGCWQPIDGTAAEPPAPAANTFQAAGTVSVAGTTGAVVHATGAYTLFTVGHDAEVPVITMTLSALPPDGRLPVVVATAADRLSGVNATSVAVTLDGAPLAATYDLATREIRLEESARTLPPGFRSGVLAVSLVDGFCNPAQASVTVISGASRIFIPKVHKP
jgi:hypothetical protein